MRTFLFGAILSISIASCNRIRNEVNELRYLEGLSIEHTKGCYCTFSDTETNLNNQKYMLFLGSADTHKVSSVYLNYQDEVIYLIDEKPLTLIGSEYLRRNYIEPHKAQLSITLDMAQQEQQDDKTWQYKGTLKLTDKANGKKLSTMIMGNCTCK